MIEVGEYVLTNLDKEGYYVVKLKDGNSYRLKDKLLKEKENIA